MSKKIILILMIFLCFACANQPKTIKKANGDSKTYLFFKDFKVNHYYVTFWDRNVSKNDDTKIIMARDKDKYYYEIKGDYNRKIIWNDGVKYTIDENLKNYFKEESKLEDFSEGILPNDLKKLKTLGYETGNQKVYSRTYIYEKYKLDNGEVTYYFKKNKLTYINYKSLSGANFLKFDSIKDDFNTKIFEEFTNYDEITY